MNKQLFLVSFYVPLSHLEKVKNAVFKAGAGKLGNYDCCAWQTKGTGQFRPLKDSKPYLGKTNKLKKVVEYKVEMICEKKHLPKVILALKRSHPYEEPAYQIIKIVNNFVMIYI